MIPYKKIAKSIISTGLIMALFLSVGMISPEETKATELRDDKEVSTTNPPNPKIDSETKTSSSKKIKTASLTKKNKKARKAYKAFLEKKKFKRTKDKKFKYALIDLDNNGIDELLIDSGGAYMAVKNNSLYTFKNGKVKKLLEVCRVPFSVYEDGTLEYGMGHMGSMEISYYKIQNGSVHKLLQMYGEMGYKNISKSERKNAEFQDEFYWWSKKIENKKVSYADCQEWIKNLQSTQKLVKLKYYKNTTKNRNSMLKK